MQRGGRSQAGIKCPLITERHSLTELLYIDIAGGAGKQADQVQAGLLIGYQTREKPIQAGSSPSAGRWAGWKQSDNSGKFCAKGHKESRGTIW